MECVNCGKLGHSFRDCTSPIMSFGIIAIKYVGNVPYFLLIRRRDSMSFVEFLRGKYKMDNSEYIQVLINGMTSEEHARLRTKSFDELWNGLWNSQHTRQFRNEYDVAKRTFLNLKNTGDVYGRLLNQYIEECSTHWETPEWGFPKGRRTLHESEKACAIREFIEETSLHTESIRLLDEPPYIEEYIGTNGIPYKQVYFLGACVASTIAELQTSNHVMSREVGDIGWFTFEEAYSHIRTTNKEKRKLLEILHTKLVSTELHTKFQDA